MSGFLKWVFSKALHASSAGAVPPSPSMKSGQVYSFRTRPYSEFGSLETGRFAAIKILGTGDQHIIIAVLDGVWGDSPTVKEVHNVSILNEYRFAHAGRPAVFGVNREWWKPESDLDEFRFDHSNAIPHPDSGGEHGETCCSGGRRPSYS